MRLPTHHYATTVAYRQPPDHYHRQRSARSASPRRRQAAAGLLVTTSRPASAATSVSPFDPQRSPLSSADRRGRSTTPTYPDWSVVPGPPSDPLAPGRPPPQPSLDDPALLGQDDAAERIALARRCLAAADALRGTPQAIVERERYLMAAVRATEQGHGARSIGVSMSPRWSAEAAFFCASSLSELAVIAMSHRPEAASGGPRSSPSGVRSASRKRAALAVPLRMLLRAASLDDRHRRFDLAAKVHLNLATVLHRSGGRDEEAFSHVQAAQNLLKRCLGGAYGGHNSANAESCGGALDAQTLLGLRAVAADAEAQLRAAMGEVEEAMTAAEEARVLAAQASDDALAAELVGQRARLEAQRQRQEERRRQEEKEKKEAEEWKQRRRRERRERRQGGGGGGGGGEASSDEAGDGDPAVERAGESDQDEEDDNDDDEDEERNGRKGTRHGMRRPQGAAFNRRPHSAAAAMARESSSRRAMPSVRGTSPRPHRPPSPRLEQAGVDERFFEGSQWDKWCDRPGSQFGMLGSRLQSGRPQSGQAKRPQSARAAIMKGDHGGGGEGSGGEGEGSKEASMRAVIERLRRPTATSQRTTRGVASNMEAANAFQHVLRSPVSMAEYLNLDVTAPTPDELANTAADGAGERGGTKARLRWKGAVKKVAEIRAVLSRLREPTKGQIAADPAEIAPTEDFRRREGWLQPPPSAQALGANSRVFKRLPAKELDRLFDRFSSERSLLSSRVQLPNGDNLDGNDYLGREGWCQLGPDPGPPPAPGRSSTRRRPGSAPLQPGTNSPTAPSGGRPSSAVGLSPRAGKWSLAAAGRLVKHAVRLAPSLMRQRVGEGDFSATVGELEARPMDTEGDERRMPTLRGLTLGEYVFKHTQNITRLKMVQRKARARARAKREKREWAAAVIQREMRKLVRQWMVMKALLREDELKMQQRLREERARLLEEREKAEAEAAARAEDEEGADGAPIASEAAAATSPRPASPFLGSAADDDEEEKNRPSWAEDLYTRSGRPAPLRRDILEKLTRRSLRIFLSSTFDDMRGERDAFMRTVVPALRTLCEQRLVDLSVIDMGWGSTSAWVHLVCADCCHL